MRDIRLLTLYKQHYLDEYDKTLNSQITCLGYYDGLDLQKVDPEEINGKKFSKFSLAPVTELWYSTGRKVEELPGGYSNQNIGLFRYMLNKKQERYTEIYWNIEKRLPFFSVAFLKLRECDRYDNVSQMIEKKFFQKKINTSEICIVLPYATFDNSDMVILLKSNSITKMEEILDQIEGMDEILYLHSILGIEKTYLKNCFEKGSILDVWQGMNCLVDESVDRIEIHLATRGKKTVLSGIKAELEKWNNDTRWGIKGYETIVYSYVIGHENINLKITGTNIRSLLVLLLPGGFSTHQNHVYKHGVYNIETAIFMNEILLNKITDDFSENPDEPIQVGWCKKLIETYRKIFEKKLFEKDESLYSYYQALIQTLNALDQYERFALSRDIFDAIFPSFRMFDGKIKTALKNWNTDENKNNIELLKEIMCKYLECVNSVVYHTIHTEQIFLMIPGYSGTSFAIPIKLKLFYSWFTYKVIELLNDSEKKYSCIIVPVMESRPVTSMIGVELRNNEKLIHIRLSQRSLFQPNLMVIVTHEMGHYVGRNIRLRDRRIQHLLKTMAYYITEGLFPDDYMGNVLPSCYSEIFIEMKKEIQKQLQETIVKIFHEKKEKTWSDGRYYVKDIRYPLMQWSMELLAAEGSNTEIYSIIHRIPKEILAKVEKDTDSYVENMRNISKLQKYLDRNRRRMLNTGIMQEIVEELISVYQEVFSDMAAIAILNCSWEDYQEAFCVSEGSGQANHTQKIQQQMRENTANVVIFNRIEQDNKCQVQEEAELSDWEANDYHRSYEDALLIGNLPKYLWVRKHLEDYARECYETIKKRLEKEAYQKPLEEIREVYKQFKQQEYDGGKIYTEISKCIAEYREMVKKEYQEEVGKILG